MPVNPEVKTQDTPPFQWKNPAILNNCSMHVGVLEILHSIRYFAGKPMPHMSDGQENILDQYKPNYELLRKTFADYYGLGNACTFEKMYDFLHTLQYPTAQLVMGPVLRKFMQQKSLKENIDNDALLNEKQKKEILSKQEEINILSSITNERNDAKGLYPGRYPELEAIQMSKYLYQHLGVCLTEYIPAIDPFTHWVDQGDLRENLLAYQVFTYNEPKAMHWERFAPDNRANLKEYTKLMRLSDKEPHPTLDSEIVEAFLNDVNKNTKLDAEKGLEKIKGLVKGNFAKKPQIVQQQESKITENQKTLREKYLPGVSDAIASRIVREIGNDKVLLAGLDHLVSNDYDQLVKLISEKKIDISKVRTWDGIENTLLGEAIFLQNKSLLFDALLKHPNIKDIIDVPDKKYGHTPLILALQLGFDDFATALIEKGANVNKPDCRGWTPLHYACFFRNEKMIQILLDKGADINARAQLDKGNKSQDILTNVSPWDLYLFDPTVLAMNHQSTFYPFAIMGDYNGGVILKEKLKNRTSQINSDLVNRLIKKEDSLVSSNLLEFSKKIHGEYFAKLKKEVSLEDVRNNFNNMGPLREELKAAYEKLGGNNVSNDDNKKRNLLKETLGELEKKYEKFYGSEHYKELTKNLIAHPNLVPKTTPKPSVPKQTAATTASTQPLASTASAETKTSALSPSKAAPNPQDSAKDKAASALPSSSSQAFKEDPKPASSVKSSQVDFSKDEVIQKIKDALSSQNCEIKDKQTNQNFYQIIVSTSVVPKDSASTTAENKAKEDITKETINVYQDSMQTTSKNIEVFKAMLIAFKAASPGEIPRINAPNEKVLEEWKTAIQEVYKDGEKILDNVKYFIRNQPVVDPTSTSTPNPKKM